MLVMGWREKYSVKIRDIDNQHKRLIELVSELSKALFVSAHKGWGWQLP